MHHILLGMLALLVILLAWIPSLPDAYAQSRALAWPFVGATTPIGRQAQWLVESETLSPQQAREAAQAGRFQVGRHDIPALGVGHPAVWMHLRVHNHSTIDQAAHFVLRATWMDHVDLYTLQDGRLLQQSHMGDALPGALGVEPGLGIGALVRLPPGETEILARFATRETMLLPVYLLDDAQLDTAQRAAHYSFGLMYGFLIVLLVYNALVGLALREPDYFYYALYLFSMLALNVAFNGFGLAWIWPDAPAVQRVAGPVLLLLKGSCGLLFACHFFRLAQEAPRLLRAVLAVTLAGMATVACAALLGAEALATLLAREYMLGAALLMFALGVAQLRRRATSAMLFTLGVTAGIGGMLITALSLRGALEITLLLYHAGGIGYVLEATLLGLGLVSRMRLSRMAHRQAELMAMRDALTGLLNRRGFADIASRVWSRTGTLQQPLSLVMLDIDHFKRINDAHGHDTGDRVLVAVAKALAQQCRSGDEVARWGGEEFIVLLPGASLAQAVGLAERLRDAVGGLDVRATDQRMSLTISLGVAQRGQHHRLEELISDADALLYQAKRTGRNRVVPAPDATPPDVA